ncbi:MAG: ester cyclase [Thermoleophilia bacterium]
MDRLDTIRRLYETINAGDLDAMRETVAEGFVEHEQIPGIEPTREGVVEWFGIMRAAFPDLRFHVDELLPSGDRVVVRAHVTGTHEGEWMGMPATGRSFSVNVIDILRVGDDGLVHEHWGVFDAMAMMEQLGAAG